MEFYPQEKMHFPVVVLPFLRFWIAREITIDANAARRLGREAQAGISIIDLGLKILKKDLRYDLGVRHGATSGFA